MSSLKLQFDPNQKYQLDAIQSIVDLFKGVPFRPPSFSLSGDVVPNIPELEEINWEPVFENFLEIQTRNFISPDTLAVELTKDEGLVLEGIGTESHNYPHFTIEMETGTGKTYVYLRSIFELRKNYGFSKFLIIVPSVAIYRGVVNSFKTMESHFRMLYGNAPVYLVEYDGDQVQEIKSFATSTFTQIMIMTIDSFNKTSNVIFKSTDKIMGELKPYEYLQKVRPILIIDEPQSTISSEKALSACRTLKPVFALRYSATHRDSPNEIYKLTPFEAFRQNLVKKIEVIGITELNDFGSPFMEVERIGKDNKGIYAEIRTNVYENNHIKESVIKLRDGSDLYKETDRNEYESKGFLVSEISMRPGNKFLEFENGVKLAEGKSVGPQKRDVFSKQIEETIHKHMVRQEELLKRGVKVLSLFFIDKVDNYVADDGLIKNLFDEHFDRLKKDFKYFKSRSSLEVRQAYFAKRKDKTTGFFVAVDTESKDKTERDLEKEAFKLIMDGKEELLSFNQPVSFIFAHSALREGWDNPNVFQICTLNQKASEIDKRQEIGRGLRLAVDQKGERVFDDMVNVLTVVANESYEQYAKTLQTEYQKNGDAPPPRPSDARRKNAIRNDEIFKSKAFKEFWSKIFKASSYEIKLESEKLVENCIKRLNRAQIDVKRILVERAKFVMIDYLIELLDMKGMKAKIRVTRRDTAGSKLVNEYSFSKGDLLSAVMNNDPNLKSFKILNMRIEDGNPAVEFSSASLSVESPINIQVQGKYDAEKETASGETLPPIFDLIGRIAKSTSLTRPTINKIFKGIKPEVKQKFLLNPEGFANVFGEIIHSELSNQVAENIQYTINPDESMADLDNLFPKEKSFPQKELISAGGKSLYDQVQKDSDKEIRFVTDHLQPDSENLAFFLKFPAAFKIPIPKVIGNYNPDWGILRKYENKNFLELIRETKGSIDLDRLQFPNEKRKLQCAMKYFEKLGVNYRVIDPDNQTSGPYWSLGDGSEGLLVAETPAGLEPFERVEKPNPGEKYKTCVPIRTLKAAAGGFSDSQEVEFDGWVRLKNSRALDRKMFVAQVVGKSMEPGIPDGAYCLFRYNLAGTRQGKVVLVQHREIHDPETGGSYTVKRYSSKMKRVDDHWEHAEITLQPENPAFQPIVLKDAEEGELKVIAELIEVLR